MVHLGPVKLGNYKAHIKDYGATLNGYLHGFLWWQLWTDTLFSFFQQGSCQQDHSKEDERNACAKAMADRTTAKRAKHDEVCQKKKEY